MKRLKITLTKAAREEFIELVDFIALVQPRAAQYLSRVILKAISKIQFFPHLGRKLPFDQEIAEIVEYRELTVSPCRIVYRVDLTEITIFAVQRTERLLRIPHLLSEAAAAEGYQL